MSAIMDNESESKHLIMFKSVIIFATSTYLNVVSRSNLAFNEI